MIGRPGNVQIRFCSNCGGRLHEDLPPGEDRPRLVCTNCGLIHYINPKVVAGSIPVRDGRILLLRRGIEPRKGFWTFPSGYLEMGETVEEAAIRETKEETSLDVRVQRLLNVYSRPEVGVVVVVYVTRIIEGEPQLGPEAEEISFFSFREIPWDDLAFLSTTWAITDWTLSISRTPGPG